MRRRLGCTLQQCDIWGRECDICVIYVCTLQQCGIWGRECSCRQLSSRRGLSTRGGHGGQGCPEAFNTRVNLIGRLLTDMIMKAFNLWYQHDVSNTLVRRENVVQIRNMIKVFYRMMIKWKNLWMGWWHRITIWWDDGFRLVWWWYGKLHWWHDGFKSVQMEWWIQTVI